MATGIELIAAERERKQKIGTRTAGKDAKLDNGELLDAAQCYLNAAFATEELISVDCATEMIDQCWPFDGDPNLSDGTIDNLVRAGALIAAEIDRLQAARTTEAKVESPDSLGPASSEDQTVKSPFSEAELLSLGFVKSVTPQSTAFVHECGVIHSRGDGRWSYAGLIMAPFKNIDDLSRFIASYKSLNAAGKALNEVLKSVVYSEGLVAIGK